MPRSALRRAIRFTGFSLGFLLVMIGVFFFVMGLAAYLSGDTSVIAYRPMLISATMVSIPACGYFLYKLWDFYKAQQNTYNMPDTPLKFYVFILMFFLFFLVMAGSLAIYLVTL